MLPRGKPNLLAPPVASSVCERLRNDLRLADLSFGGGDTTSTGPGITPLTGLSPLMSFGRAGDRAACDRFIVDVRRRGVPTAVSGSGRSKNPATTPPGGLSSCCCCCSVTPSRSISDCIRSVISVRSSSTGGTIPEGVSTACTTTALRVLVAAAAARGTRLAADEEVAAVVIVAAGASLFTFATRSPFIVSVVVFSLCFMLTAIDGTSRRPVSPPAGSGAAATFFATGSRLVVAAGKGLLVVLVAVTLLVECFDSVVRVTVDIVREEADAGSGLAEADPVTAGPR